NGRLAPTAAARHSLSGTRIGRASNHRRRRFCPVGGWRGDMREELLEGADAHPSADVGRGVVEQLVQRLLGVAKGALEVGVVTPPDGVAVAGPGHGQNRAAM